MTSYEIGIDQNDKTAFIKAMQTNTEEVKVLGVTLQQFSKMLEEYNKTLPNIATPEQQRLTNEISEFLKNEREKQNSLKSFTDMYGERQGGQMWHQYARDNILGNRSLSDEEKQSALGEAQGIYDSRLQQATAKDIKAMAQEVNEIFSDTLSEIILDFDNFDKSMSKMTDRLLKYLLNQMQKSFIDGILNLGGDKSIASLFNQGSKSNNVIGGILGGLGSVLTGGKKLPFHHSGGVIPNAGYELGGTAEQLAILKGGERVLSPGENVEYSRGEESGQRPTIVNNNFVVKAWDSKDVSKYFLENKTLINSITYDAIKNNNNQLRTMISHL